MPDKPTDTEQLVAAQLTTIALADDENKGLVEARLHNYERQYIADVYVEMLQLVTDKREELFGKPFNYDGITKD